MLKMFADLKLLAVEEIDQKKRVLIDVVVTRTTDHSKSSALIKMSFEEHLDSKPSQSFTKV